MLNFKYKITNKETASLEEIMETSRHIWNYALRLQRKSYEWYGKYIPYNKLRAYIVKKRKHEPYWLRLNSHWVDSIIQSLDDSYQRFFKGIQKRPPKFKKYGESVSILAKWNVSYLDGVKIENDRITLKKVGTYKFLKHRAYPTDKIRQVRIKKYNNHFYVIVCCDCSPKQLARNCNGEAGIDFGLKTFITLDNGEKIESPRFLFKNAKKLRRLNKVVSRRQKGSNRRKKAVVALANFHAKVKHYIFLSFISDLSIFRCQRAYTN